MTDDGAGFDPALVNGGYGLSGMRARVDEAGGTVAVRSAPAQGTSVQVEVPDDGTWQRHGQARTACFADGADRR